MSPCCWVQRMRATRMHLCILGPLLLVFASAPARAEELPSSLRASLLVRILAYDRRMSMYPPPLTVAVIHREGDERSRLGGLELSTALETAARGRSIARRPLRVVRVGFRDAAQLQQELSQQKVVALYSCDGLEVQSELIAGVTRRLSILSITGSERQVNQGLSIGLSRKGNTPVILVHLSAVRAEGADLDAGLLSLSQLVEPSPGGG